MTKKSWNTPTLTTYGSVEQLTEQVNVSKVPGPGDTITITVVGGPTTTVTVAGSLESATTTFP